ncbi:unnamed protein product [Orchesella dallaii]|uniref:BAH domain-containing protein n=1 Tax=Orchesella dallaii TaxID=48710 RepID=A0ABP1Q7S0_9HEXA
MGKAKPVKKVAQSPLKISTSLFQRKSKTSQGAGQIDRDASNSGSSKGKGKGSTPNTKGKQPKRESTTGGKTPSKSTVAATKGKDASSSTSKKSNSPSSNKQKTVAGKKAQEKRSSSPVETKSGKEKASSSSSSKKGKVGAGKNSVTPVKAAAKGKATKQTPSDGEKSKSTSSTKGKKASEKVKSRDSREDKSPSPSRRRSPELEKITTRKRSKSDSESPPPQKQAKVGGKGSKINKTNKKESAQKKASTTTTKDVAKKAAKKAVASIVASKKKTVVKSEKSGASNNKSNSSSSTKAKESKDKKKVGETKKKPVKAVKVKPKAKPRTKIKLKRMASLNAKAILEASFSFEPSEKKQRSPAPSSSSQKVKSSEESPAVVMKDVGVQDTKPSISNTTLSATKNEPKMKDAAVSVSVSTSTSPIPPKIPEPTQNVKNLKSNPASVKSGEKKRKSNDASNRRESTSSNKGGSKDTPAASFTPPNNLISVGTSTSTTVKTPTKQEKTAGKVPSRRSSATGTSVSSDASTSTSTSSKAGKEKEKGGKSSNPKKKQKMVAAATITTSTTSTSTSTSPIPMWNECDKAVEQRATATTASLPKQKKHRSNSTGGGKDKVQDSSSQVQQGQLSHHHSTSSSSKHKSASYQAKDKPTTPVALYGSGTVYQPAGPLIEPHKQSSVPAGILPETVRLPPDLKVTYQTHPPSSAFVATSETQTKTSSSSSKSHKSSSSSSSTSTHKSEKSAGTILHQPYKSSTSSSSHASPSPSLTRTIPSSYSSGSGYASSTGTPLLSPSDQTLSTSHHHHLQASSAAASVASVHGTQLGSVSGGGSLSMAAHHPHHSLSSAGSIAGVGSQHTQNSGAPSSSGLFYTTNYGPHHSPFAPCKYPIVPPDAYRTQSPFQNSFLCPPTTPQPSQSYFMTPFYTPPLTPNPTPGIGTVGPSQPRPLSLSSAASHHQSAAAAAAYYQQQGVPLSQQPPPSAAAHLPTSYYMPSPQHHSIHPTPAPGHAGPFRPNQSSQPACPCPTESYPLNSNCTNNNIRPPPLLQRPSPSSVSLPVPEVGAKLPQIQSTSPALVSATASRPSRNNKESPQHPPTCVTPAVAADPPSGMHIIPSPSDAQQTQVRQLESAKTFTEQYSLPDDITITPIMPPNSNTNKVLLMLNSSVSVIPTSAPSTTTTTLSLNKTSSNAHDGLLKHNNSSNHHSPTKPKEKDIVHVIDPRSGQRTTIAKHISNNSRIAGNLSDNNKIKAQLGKNSTNLGDLGKPKTPSRMETVRKLNPDLDVIVINRGDLSRSDKIENIETMDLSTGGGSAGVASPNKPSRVGHQGQSLKQMPPLKPGRLAPNKMHPVPFSAISSSVMGITPGFIHQQQGNKRVALAHNDNNFHRNGNESGSGNNSILKLNQKRSKAHSNNSVPIHGNNSTVQSVFPNSARGTPKNNASVPTSMGVPFSMPILPPGISISAGSGNNMNAIDDMQPTNLSKKSYGNTNFQSVNRLPVQVNQAYLNHSGVIQQKAKAIKRSLNECIDGLQLQHQQKKLKMLEQHSNGGSRMHVFGNGSPSPSSSARTGIYNVNGGKPTFSQSVSSQQMERQRQHVANFNKSRPIPQIPVFGRETTTAARVRDPDFELKLGGMLINSNDAVNAVSALVVEPFDYSFSMRQSVNLEKNGLGRKGKEKVHSKPSTIPSYAFTEAKKKVTKLKARHGERGNRGIGASKSKIRTRLSVRPKGLHGNSAQPLGSRSRSRLLRKRSLLCNPNASTSRKSESDSSVCASRSSSTVRIISGVGQNGVKAGGKDRDRDKPRNTQAFINATADLYQYRRSVILRVPSPKPMSSAALNLNRTAGADAIARMGDVSPDPSRSDTDRTKTEIPRELAAHQMAQLARTHIMMVNQPAIQAQESKGPAGIPRFPSGSMVVNAMKKRAGLKPLSPASVNGALSQQLLLNSRRQPKWSNGWRFEGEPYDGKIYVKNDDTPLTRKCYPSMRHDGGDIIRTRDCVLLKSGPRKNDLPFIAKIAALWENPGDGEMMFSLLWYYRPEHTELGRTKDDMMDEIFASKHRDTNSVATIEDRCYVLTFNEYCRYRKRLTQLEQGIPDSTLVPFADTAMVNTNAAAKIAEAVWNGICDPSMTIAQGKVSPEVVFFCRKVYDFRQKRILKNPS